MPKLTVDTFGAKGVNTVDSPIHLSDDDLTHAQNAEVSYEDGYPAIRKRLGMTQGVTTAMDGAVLGFSSIPLPDPTAAIPEFGRLFFRPNGFTGGDEIGYSDDGAAWSFVAAVLGGSFDTTSWNSPTVTPALPYFDDGTYNYLVYLAYNAGSLNAYSYNPAIPDNTLKITDLTGVASATAAPIGYGAKFASEPVFFVLFAESSDGTWRISKCDASAGTATANWSDIFGPGGDVTAETPHKIGYHYNKLVIITTELSGGFNISRFRSAAVDVDGASTIEETISSSAANHVNNWNIVVGSAYAIAGCTGANASATARLMRRNISGSWSEVYTAAAGFNVILPVYCSGDEFLFWIYDPVAQTLELKRSTNAGASWTTVVTRSGVSSTPNGFTQMLKIGTKYVWGMESAGGGPFDEDILNYVVGSGESVVQTVTLPGVRGFCMLGGIPATV